MFVFEEFGHDLWSWLFTLMAACCTCFHSAFNLPSALILKPETLMSACSLWCWFITLLIYMFKLFLDLIVVFSSFCSYFFANFGLPFKHPLSRISRKENCWLQAESWASCTVSRCTQGRGYYYLSTYTLYKWLCDFYTSQDQLLKEKLHVQCCWFLNSDWSVDVD